MATLTIPDAVARRLVAAFKQQLGDAAASLTAAQVLARGVGDLCEPMLYQYDRARQIDGLVASQLAAREAAVQAARDAEEQERAARKAAEATIAAQAKADLGGIS